VATKNQMKPKFQTLYMNIAQEVSTMSQARRLQVGAIVVKDDRIISIGYNGMPSGWDNNCEDKDYMSGDAGGWIDPDEIAERWPFDEVVHEPQSDDTVWTHTRRFRLKTKPEVLHAETNAIAKLAKSSDSGSGAVMFVTHSPCLDCAKLVYQSGISCVVYRDSYRSDSGVDFLQKSGVEVIKLDA
jgi:dCMP deaminase